MSSPASSQIIEEPKNYNVRLISGNSNPKLASDIAKILNIPLEPITVRKFADGEIDIHIHNNIRGADCFILQPTCPDVNTNLMELLLLIHTLKLASAKRITAIVPYFGYARQDRKCRPRVPISASAVAQLIETMGVHHLVIVDLHSGQIQGFFHQIPVDNLFAENQFINTLHSRDLDLSKTVVVSPDAGGVARAKRVADLLGEKVGVVTILKRRAAANKIESMQIVGDIKGMTCIIYDDIIDTAGTLTKAAQLLKEHGAAKVLCCASHGLFSGSAIENINNSCLDEVIVTDSIPQEKSVAASKKITVVSIAPLLSEAIVRLHEEKSLSQLFDKYN